MSKYICVGDLHGCIDPLNAIISKYGIDSTYVFLGDLIDRGQHSKEVLSTVYSLKNKIILRGNHEDMMLDGLSNSVHWNEGLYNWINNGGATVLISYGVDPVEIKFLWQDGDIEAIQRLAIKAIPQEHLDMLRSAKLFYETDKHIFVHAGIDPLKPLSEQHDHNLMWIRNYFLRHEDDYPDNKFICHGHTPQQDMKNAAKKHRLNHDGGYCYNGYVIASVIDTDFYYPEEFTYFFADGRQIDVANYDALV
jgi:serine/threonine protein phosphatase 1